MPPLNHLFDELNKLIILLLTLWSKCFDPFIILLAFSPATTLFFPKSLVWKWEHGPHSFCVASAGAKGRVSIVFVHHISPLYHISLLEQCDKTWCSSCHLVWPQDFVRGTAQGQAHHLKKCSLKCVTPRWKPVWFYIAHCLFMSEHARPHWYQLSNQFHLEY